MKKGAFNLNGNVPGVEDQRIMFIKGWFQNTLPGFIKNNDLSDNLIVHFDSDIFSATLFVLLELDRLKKSYSQVNNTQKRIYLN